MQEEIDKIQVLLTEAETFTYENFSTKSSYGYAESELPKWITWTTRVTGAITALFGPHAAQAALLKKAHAVRLLGNGHDKFQQALSYYKGALLSALETLNEDTFNEIGRGKAQSPGQLSSKVFIVHGHDQKAKNELEILLRELGLDPIVLHRQADGGRTIIEKFEEHADVGFAFIILTPDEFAYPVEQNNQPDTQRTKETRARPNVIFEFGYFVGRLGRARTCCLHRGAVDLPSDLNGLIYKKFDQSVEEVAYAVTKELKAAGYKLR